MSHDTQLPKDCCFMVMGHCFRFKYNRTGSVLQKFTDETIPEGSALLWKGTWIKCDCFHFTVLWYGCMNDMFCNWDLYFGGERRDLETNAYIMKISLTKLWQTTTKHWCCFRIQAVDWQSHSSHYIRLTTLGCEPLFCKHVWVNVAECRRYPFDKFLFPIRAVQVVTL